MIGAYIIGLISTVIETAQAAVCFPAMSGRQIHVKHRIPNVMSRLPPPLPLLLHGSLSALLELYADDEQGSRISHTSDNLSLMRVSAGCW